MLTDRIDVPVVLVGRLGLQMLPGALHELDEGARKMLSILGDGALIDLPLKDVEDLVAFFLLQQSAFQFEGTLPELPQITLPVPFVGRTMVSEGASTKLLRIVHPFN